MSNQTELDVHIRRMIRRDMQEVLNIEFDSFQFPWESGEFIRCLRQGNAIGWIAEHDERVAGYLIYEIYQKHLRLINFSVASEYRRRRVGTQMISKMIGKLHPSRRYYISASVRESNLGAQLFFRNRGFTAVETLRQFYDETEEDAYLFEYRV